MSGTRTPPTLHGGSYLRDPAHGPLPALLVVLTAVTGLIDAVSILDLGRVFVANMTGNVVFLGFALARAPRFSLAASAAALAGFLLGGVTGGRLIALRGRHRGLLLRDGSLSQFALVARSLAVPDLTTTVLTMTLTGIAADRTPATGGRPCAGWWRCSPRSPGRSSVPRWCSTPGSCGDWPPRLD
jgi:uncharacterized membrane protein YoaK (UPF0700 family)